MRLIFLLLWCAISSEAVFAQTAPEDAQRILAPLVNAQYLYYENRYLYYEEGRKTATDTLDGIFQRDGDRKYMRMGLLEVLALNDLIVSVDHEDKIVSAQTVKPAQPLNDLVDAQKLQGLLKTSEITAQYTTGRGTWKAISLIDPERRDDRMIVYYDPASWIIQEAQITTNDPYANPLEKTGKVTIVVQYLKYSTAQRAFPYKIENYVRKSGKKYAANGKCRGYRAI